MKTLYPKTSESTGEEQNKLRDAKLHDKSKRRGAGGSAPKEGTQSTPGRQEMQPRGLDGSVHTTPLSFYTMNVGYLQCQLVLLTARGLNVTQ